MSIKTFKHKELQKLYLTGKTTKIAARYIKKIMGFLDRLDVAQNPNDMNFPGSDFHPLKGKLKAFHAIHVSGNWVIIFRFEGNDVYDVDYLDYH